MVFEIEVHVVSFVDKCSHLWCESGLLFDTSVCQHTQICWKREEKEVFGVLIQSVKTLYVFILSYLVQAFMEENLIFYEASFEEISWQMASYISDSKFRQKLSCNFSGPCKESMSTRLNNPLLSRRLGKWCWLFYLGIAWGKKLIVQIRITNISFSLSSWKIK